MQEEATLPWLLNRKPAILAEGGLLGPCLLVSPCCESEGCESCRPRDGVLVP